MRIKCKETETFQNTTNNFISVSKGLENIIAYINAYIESTNEYVEKLKALNSKCNINQKKNQLSGIEEYFRRIRIVINSQIISLSRFNDMVNTEIKKCGIILSEQIECQKKFKKEVEDAEDDYETQIKEIEKAKRGYHFDASTLEGEVKAFEKKSRGTFKKSIDDDGSVYEAIKKMVKSESNYFKKLSKSHRFKQTFIERILASTGSIQQLYEELEKMGKEITVNTMLYLKIAGKELLLEIDTYSLHQDKTNIFEHNNSTNSQTIYDYLADLTMEPYKLKLFAQEQTEDLSEEEIYNVIKTMYENMKQKPIEVI